MADIWWYGQACFKVKGKDASVVFDPYDPSYTGLKPQKLDANIVCVTHDHGDHNNSASVKGVEEGESPFVIKGPGEYEKNGVNVVGIQSFHDESGGSERGNNTIYLATVDDINIVHLGDLGQKTLTEEQKEELSLCDVLMIPVGGVYTITAKEAPDIISSLEPKIVIPMHYKTPGLKFGLDGVEGFLKAMGKEESERVSKLSVSRDKLPEELEIVLLEMQ
ncbi:hypothetical protein A3A54_01290 [Candidatus Curtissbacteria bacterium RIFCSPLOWO2_01_FULL_39_62]|uniref:Lactamase n=2 Tax=Candidatus Curtissiibacteriota TaxID=1752717 RepID=A0A1F5G7V1_9BACT|nr:MAG: hypothetical protein A2775_01260 [Candidatus Curtissbacteria bacterium RIFCSPHIGHO2_01_FULL_39_57]OGD87895.1 MAG: hypothetical protein A3D04_01790 [Candidatus Curtissbacteria bacterium RIFCSPHIGHO2_02_FULL_40_16b]OGD90312.1 MAG: hypothetical protein A3E11_01270 [Candidatus Curtissbacteria bacterium RIFCSPHIGHO2_12_FULL_38_37]OGE01972.1 MAG: hypothetical protein A3A54_01290 [Candidatus Curtissbacteria bacterium RIFCSPLOWO2_01_FULL_39_62]OGE12148.1 MAG: hypothetical protein A3G14_01095 [C